MVGHQTCWSGPLLALAVVLVSMATVSAQTDTTCREACWDKCFRVKASDSTMLFGLVNVYFLFDFSSMELYNDSIFNLALHVRYTWSRGNPQNHFF
jgi:hypothetical protein